MMIEVSNLTKRYAGNTAVEDLSFTVARGEIAGLLGPNGAGKSTTMRILACFTPATSGEARVAGLDVQAQADEKGKPAAPAGGAPEGTGQDANKSPIACDPSPCSFTKTVTHYDPEYWDVSLGVSVPGVMEPSYKTTTANGTTTYSLGTPTRHTDAYAFLDVYPFQGLAGAPTNLTEIPHFNLGIPISSQSLHRPYVGVAENFSFFTKRIKLGIPISAFVGTVFLKQQVYVPSTSSLKWDHAIKLMYGVELPISSITKYMKGGGNSSSGNKPSGSSAGSGS